MLKRRIVSLKSRTEHPDVAKFKMHTHETYELFMFLSGDGKYFVEGSVYPLFSGDILIMKKAEAHSLLLNNSSPYERMVVHFTAKDILSDKRAEILDFLDSRPLGKYNKFPAASFKDSAWQYYILKICESDDNAQKQIYLTVLLSELYSAFPLIKTNEAKQRNNIIDIINYINAHLTETLSLDKLCATFFISKAQLNRNFKRMTGTTVWSYIQTKRLLLAREMLGQGQNPTKVAASCGFNDYCSFFRAYKQRFSVSPKNNRGI